MAFHFQTFCIVRALMKNIAVLAEYCKEQAETHSDPVCKYCYTKLTDPQQVCAALIVFDNVIQISGVKQAVAKKQPDSNQSRSVCDFTPE